MSELCKCYSYVLVYHWQMVVMQITGHHPECEHNKNPYKIHNNVIDELVKTIRDLVTGCMEWGAEEDGIPEKLGTVNIYETCKMAVEKAMLLDLRKRFKEDKYE